MSMLATSPVLCCFQAVADAKGRFVIQDHPCASLPDLLKWASRHLQSYTKPGTRLRLGKPVTTEPWFAGHFDKLDVEKAVLAAPHGHFLVRKSSDGRKFVVVVHDRGQAANFTLDPVRVPIPISKQRL